MKKAVLWFVLVFAADFVFGQARLPTAAVATFDTVGAVTPDEAAVVTELFMSEIVKGGKINVVDRNNFDKIVQQMRFQLSDWSDNNKIAQLGRALNAEYIIRGQVMKMGNTIYITSSMFDVNTTSTIASAREQLNSFDVLFTTLPKLSQQILDKLPEQNWLVGRWQAKSDDRICIIEFKADRTIVIERYDYEYDKSSYERPNDLKGKGSARGTGFYSTDKPNSGGSLTINISLTGSLDLDNFGRNIEFNDDTWFNWKDSSKSSFNLYRVTERESTFRFVRGKDETYGLLSGYWGRYRSHYYEFFRLQ
jgi:TolB-like protein